MRIRQMVGLQKVLKATSFILLTIVLQLSSRFNLFLYEKGAQNLNWHYITYVHPLASSWFLTRYCAWYKCFGIFFSSIYWGDITWNSDEIYAGFERKSYSTDRFIHFACRKCFVIRGEMEKKNNLEAINHFNLSWFGFILSFFEWLRKF